MATLNETLRLLVHLTAAQSVQWVEIGSSAWRMANGPVDVVIEYLRPLLPDGTTPGNDIARISIWGYVDEVCAGTEGMELVRRVLDAAFPSQAEWSAGCEAKLNRSYDRLAALLPPQHSADDPDRTMQQTEAKLLLTRGSAVCLSPLRPCRTAPAKAAGYAALQRAVRRLPVTCVTVDDRQMLA